MAPFNVAAAGIDLFFSIPILGRILKMFWNAILTLLNMLAGLIEFLLMSIGVMPEKKLRISVVLFKSEEEGILAEPDEVVKQLQNAVKVFKDQANIRLIPISPYQSKTKAEYTLASPDWIHIPEKPVSSDVLDVHCNLKAFLEDLWITGSKYQISAMTSFFYGNFLRIIGYGSPIIVFIVRSIHRHGGCSLGPLSDYVTVHRNNLACIAHEVGHACNLLHDSDKHNLMYSRICGLENMTRSQVAWVRASRHVTLF